MIAHDVNLFVSHSVATLPDSFQARLACLRALCALLPRGELRTEIRILLQQIESHEKAQQEFHFDKSRDGNGEQPGSRP